MTLVDGEPIDYSRLPEMHREAMQLYMEHRIYPGSGLAAVLRHDLSAVVICDADTVEQLPVIFRWLVNHAPRQSHGSKENVVAWMAKGRQ